MRKLLQLSKHQFRLGFRKISVANFFPSCEDEDEEDAHAIELGSARRLAHDKGGTNSNLLVSRNSSQFIWQNITCLS